MKIYRIFYGILIIFITIGNNNNLWGQHSTYNNCWDLKHSITLLDTMLKVMSIPIEETYKQHDFIQTFGCAYEEDDIEQNSIRAVYRAILQSIRNRVEIHVCRILGRFHSIFIGVDADASKDKQLQSADD